MGLAVKVTAILHHHHRHHTVNIRQKNITAGKSSISRVNLTASLASITCRGTSTSEASGEIIAPLEVNEIKEICSKWVWKGYTINYLKYEGQNGNISKAPPPVLLVHGFGASVAHWRRNIPTLAQTSTVRAIDLLGFGASDKPEDFEYTMEAWAQIIREPALAEGEMDAFVSIITGPSGPNPVQLMPQIKLPVLILWGDDDPFTPLDGPVGKYFSSLPSQVPNVSLSVLPGVGHCPHDDRPNLVYDKLVPWLTNLPSS